MSEIPAPTPAPDPAAATPPPRGIPATLAPPPQVRAGAAQTAGPAPPPTPGQPLKATVLESRPGGQLVLATAEGTLAVVARQPIPEGTRLLVLARQAPGGNALVLLPEPEAGTGATLRAVPSGPARTDSAPVAPNRPPTVDFQPLRLRAQVQLAAPADQRVDLAGRPLPSIPTGGRLSLQILAITPATAGAVGSGTGPAPAAAAPTPAAGLPGPLAAATPTPGAAPTLQGGFHGQVTARAPDGRPVIATPLGTLVADRPANLPTGAGLLLALEGPVPAPGAMEGSSPRGHPSMAWPVLTEALATEPAPPDAAPNPVNAGAPGAQAALPQPGARLASGLLFFLSALRGGDLAGWLETAVLGGRDPAKLGALRGRLGQEAAQAARQAEQPLGDWRLIPIPLLHEGRIEPLHLLIRRRRRGGRADGEEGDATRFLLEVELSHLGELQLDGLTRGRRFDLILRSRRPLSAAMRRDVTAIFENANAVGGSRGQIAFHASSGWSFLAKRLAGGQATDSLTA